MHSLLTTQWRSPVAPCTTLKASCNALTRHCLDRPDCVLRPPRSGNRRRLKCLPCLQLAGAKACSE